MSDKYRGFEQHYEIGRNQSLSNVPYYIQDMQREIARLDFKLNNVLAKLDQLLNPSDS